VHVRVFAGCTTDETTNREDMLVMMPSDVWLYLVVL